VTDAASLHAEFLADSAWARRSGEDVCDFVFGDPRELPPAGYVDALRRAAVARDPSWFAYKANTPAAREVACASLRERLGVPFEPGDLFLTRGASAALAIALAALVEPGEEVVFLNPPWFFYESMITYARAVPVAVDVDMATFDPDVAAIAAAITSRTRAVIVNTPNNPTGRIYPPAVLAELADALRSASARHGRPIHLISDEAYNRIVLDGGPFSSPAAYYPDTLVLYSYGKTLLTPGQRLGYLALAPDVSGRDRLRRAILLAQFAGGAFGVPDALLQHALPDLEPLCVDLGRLARRRDLLVGALREQGYEVHRPEGTFYVLVRAPAPDEGPLLDVLAEHDVYVLPGRMVGMPGHFRISLTATDEMVERSLERFGDALHAYTRRALAPPTPGGRR
jgi:aspartate aminotransferase